MEINAFVAGINLALYVAGFRLMSHLYWTEFVFDPSNDGAGVPEGVKAVVKPTAKAQLFMALTWWVIAWYYIFKKKI